MYLANGSTGSNVSQVQSALGIASDGVYGAGTKAAVQKYQTSKGLTADGIVGGNTYSSLFGGSDSGLSAAPSNSNSNIQAKSVNVPTVAPLTIDKSGAPKAEVMPNTPTYVAYNPNLNMSNFISQAHTQLAPQLANNDQTINDQNIVDNQKANNDTLSRGLARGSYGGARIDTITADKNKQLGVAQMNNDIQANSLAGTNYNTAYTNGYNANKDLNANNWNVYGAGVTAANTNYTNAYNNYRANVGDQKDAYTANTANTWKTYDATNAASQAALAQSNVNRTYDQSVTAANQAQSNTDRSYNQSVSAASQAQANNLRDYNLTASNDAAAQAASKASGSSAANTAATTKSVSAATAYVVAQVYDNGGKNNTTAKALAYLTGHKAAILTGLINSGMTPQATQAYYLSMYKDLTGQDGPKATAEAPAVAPAF